MCTEQSYKNVRRVKLYSGNKRAFVWNFSFTTEAKKLSNEEMADVYTILYIR